VGFEPTTTGLGGVAKQEKEKLLFDFKTFCMVDLQLTQETAKGHKAQIKRLLKWLNGQPLTQYVIRDYLSIFNHMSRSTYANVLKSLKVFCRDYLRKPKLVESFKFPKKQFKPKSIPSKKELQQFFDAIDSVKEKTLFLLYASSGLRRREILTLRIKDIDFNNCMIKPKSHEGRTKLAWVSFFNPKASEFLKRYMESRHDNNPKLFPMAKAKERKLWRSAREKTGFDVTPQVLREWFCATMGELGIPDRYVDAFCGRVPSSVLAKHYTDYNPEKLKEVYDKASIKLLD